MAYQPIQLPSVDPVQGYRDLAATLAASRESERQRDYQRAQILLQQRAQESEDARYARNAANAERQIASVERAQRANALEAALKEADPAKRMALLKMAGFQVEEGDEVKVPMGGIQQPQPGAAPPVSQPQGGSALPDALEQPKTSTLPGQTPPAPPPGSGLTGFAAADAGMDRFASAMGKGVPGIRELAAARASQDATQTPMAMDQSNGPAAPPASPQGAPAAPGAAPVPGPEMLSLGRKQTVRGENGEVLATLDPMEKYQRDQQRQQIVENALGPAFEAYRPMIKSMLSIPDMDPKTVLSTVLERADRDQTQRQHGQERTESRGWAVEDRDLKLKLDREELAARERMARKRGAGGPGTPKEDKNVYGFGGTLLGTAATPTVAREVNDRSTQLRTIDGLVNNIVGSFQKESLGPLPTDEKARREGNMSRLLTILKEEAKLGALSGDDMQLMVDVIGTAGTWRPGQTIEKLKVLRQNVYGSAVAYLDSRGFDGRTMLRGILRGPREDKGGGDSEESSQPSGPRPAKAQPQQRTAPTQPQPSRPAPAEEGRFVAGGELNPDALREAYLRRRAAREQAANPQVTNPQVASGPTKREWKF